MLGRVNVVSGHVKTQLIAHDKEVYDIAFSRAGGGRDMFASVGKISCAIHLCMCQGYYVLDETGLSGENDQPAASH